MRRLLVVLLLVATATVVVRGQVPCTVLAVQPSCDVALLPGPTANTFELVEIQGEETYTSSGQLRLTTVAVDSDLDFLEWVGARFSSSSNVVERSTLYPPGTSDEEVAEQNELLMNASQNDATVAGLVAAGYEAEELYAGARVVDLADDPAEGADQLSSGDVIVAVGGESILNAREAVDAVATHAPGDDVTLRLEDGSEVTITAKAHPDDPDRALLGILLEDELTLPFDVQIDAGNIGGPSAGLLFALGIVDLLGPDDLTDGRTIAGTGTITVDGEVGAIGGIRQKIVGATDPSDEEAEPAEVFLVPAGNLAEARSAPVARDVLLVPVATIDDALSALRELARGGQPEGAVALGP